ncbi:MAG: tRNA (5-methylaminomethyl-2-thiouridine)(34)-methyltransferase MnmD [Bacteroidales bacterium]|jgi:tRNA U34 5-methylaminomethyl-2-thiouridine-forming methyltransferase MnmC
MRIITTRDGSHTLYVPELDEHYHSIHGAVQESEHIFLKAGYDKCMANPVNIFEVGLGTGLNALLTAMRSISDQRIVFYTAVEKYPLENEILAKLNYNEFTGPEGGIIYKLIHGSSWGKMNSISPGFSLLKVKGDLTVYVPDGHYDLVYFDAFGPDKQPEMWTKDVMERIAATLMKGAILVTFSVKGEVRRNLQAAGFEVTIIPGPPGKRQMIRAYKT